MCVVILARSAVGADIQSDDLLVPLASVHIAIGMKCSIHPLSRTTGNLPVASRFPSEATPL